MRKWSVGKHCTWQAREHSVRLLSNVAGRLLSKIRESQAGTYVMLKFRVDELRHKLAYEITLPRVGRCIEPVLKSKPDTSCDMWVFYGHKILLRARKMYLYNSSVLFGCP